MASQNKLVDKASVKCWQLYKWARWHRPFAGEHVERRVVLIVGCQRSGTGMLGRIFENDPRSRVLGEDSVLTKSNDERLRLKPLPVVNSLLERMRYPLIVAKPLVESQHTPELLDAIRDSRAIWLYRHYRDVVQSNVVKFTTQLERIRNIRDAAANNWRTERVSPETRQLVTSFYRDDMSREDAAALMWYARNILFFERGLDQHPKVLLLRYEELVQQPAETIRGMYRFLEMSPPEDNVAGEVHARSIGLGSKVPLTPDIEELCSNLLERLQDCARKSKECAVGIAS